MAGSVLSNLIQPRPSSLEQRVGAQASHRPFQPELVHNSHFLPQTLAPSFGFKQQHLVVLQPEFRTRAACLCSAQSTWGARPGPRQSSAELHARPLRHPGKEDRCWALALPAFWADLQTRSRYGYVYSPLRISVCPGMHSGQNFPYFPAELHK